MESKTKIQSSESKNQIKLPKDMVISIFHSLEPKDILKLCSIDTNFNSACQSELLWKNLCLIEYGIDNKILSTWKDTAKLLIENKMFNLNDKWVVTDETYRDLYNRFRLLPNARDDFVKYIDEKYWGSIASKSPTMAYLIALEGGYDESYFFEDYPEYKIENTYPYKINKSKYISKYNGRTVFSEDFLTKEIYVIIYSLNQNILTSDQRYNNKQSWIENINMLKLGMPENKDTDRWMIDEDTITSMEQIITLYNAIHNVYLPLIALNHLEIEEFHNLEKIIEEGYEMPI